MLLASVSTLQLNPMYDVGQWLRKLFLQKEKVLQSFYTHPSITGAVDKNTNTSKNMEHWPPVIYTSSQISLPTRILHIIGVPIYTLSTLALVYYSSIYRYIVLLLCVLFAISPLFNGFDTVELRMTDNDRVYEATSGGKKLK